jgi:hypothetical protein
MLMANTSAGRALSVTEPGEIGMKDTAEVPHLAQRQDRSWLIAIA